MSLLSLEDDDDDGRGCLTPSKLLSDGEMVMSALRSVYGDHRLLLLTPCRVFFLPFLMAMLPAMFGAAGPAMAGLAAAAPAAAGAGAAGALGEEVSLFDVFRKTTGDDSRSLAFAVRLRQLHRLAKSLNVRIAVPV